MISNYIRSRRIGKEIEAIHSCEVYLKSRYFAIVVRATEIMNKQRFLDTFDKLYESKYNEDAKILWMELNTIEDSTDAKNCSVLCRELRNKIEKEIPFYCRGLLLNIKGTIVFLTFLECFVLITITLIIFLVVKML